MGEESPKPASTPTGAVFLSYASEDAPAARRLCQDLRAADIEVWIDQSELRGGDAWDAAIQKQIRECALFVPLISASTNSRGEGYFRLEWRLAVERSHRLADDQAFLLPVVIDATPETLARVPDRFRERHWSQLEGGAATPAFISQVRRLLSTPHGVATALQSQAVPGGTAPRRRGRLVAGAALFAVVAAGLVTYVKWNGNRVESMLHEHAAALTTVERAQALAPEAHDAVNGPELSFWRSVILVRAGRSAGGYAEAVRLLRVPFGAPLPLFFDHPEVVILKDDPHFDALINHAPQL